MTNLGQFRVCRGSVCSGITTVLLLVLVTEYGSSVGCQAQTLTMIHAFTE